MFYSKKADHQPIPEEETDIWECSGEDCSCWMRNNFTFETEPTCPLCASSMLHSTRVLPVVMNYSG